jgi:hypothetical protein
MKAVNVLQVRMMRVVRRMIEVVIDDVSCGRWQGLNLMGLVRKGRGSCL